MENIQFQCLWICQQLNDEISNYFLIAATHVAGSSSCFHSFSPFFFYTSSGKTYTMIGKDSSTQNLGIVPCAISWLFKLINERKEKMGTRFSVRVSAVEIFGKDEELKDLLSEVSTESVQEGQSPGIHLREDPICGTQV